MRKYSLYFERTRGKRRFFPRKSKIRITYYNVLRRGTHSRVEKVHLVAEPCLHIGENLYPAGR